MSTINPQYWALILILLIVLWIGSGLLSNANETQRELVISNNDKNLNEAYPLVRYEVMTSKNYYSDFKILATTKAENKIELKSETDGIIQNIPNTKGAFVEKGSVICELEINDRQEVYNMALANLRKMETKYQSFEIELLNSAKAKVEESASNYISSKKLVAKGYAPKNQLISRKVNLETARAELKKAENEILSREVNLETARAELKKAQIELNKIKIKAPFSGTIDHINPKIGELVTKGNICAKLINNNPMLVIGNISERNIDKLKIGMSVDIKLITNEVLKGKINFISSSAEPNTRTYLVEAIKDNKDHKVKDGITAEIIITVKSELAHKFSPAILSLDDNGTTGIKTINDNNLVEFHPVDIINLDDSGAVAINLPKILKVITVGQDYVNVGQKVDPVQYNIEQNE